MVQTTIGNQQPVDMCGTTYVRVWVLEQAKAESLAKGRSPAHSLVSEYHTLDAGTKENHTAEVCGCVKES